MARQRNPLRDEAHRIWIKSNKRKPLKDIAKELGVSDSTVRKWKSEDKWGGETKRSAPIETERYDSMKGNKNAKGLFTTVVETTLVKSMFSLNPLKF